MGNCNKLKELLKFEILPDIEDEIDELFEQIAREKKADKDKKDEYSKLQDLRNEFIELLKGIENENLDQNECKELYLELVKMIESS